MKIQEALFEARQFRTMSAPKGFAMWGGSSQRAFRKAARNHFKLLAIAETAFIFDDPDYEEELIKKLNSSTMAMRTFYW